MSKVVVGIVIAGIVGAALFGAGLWIGRVLGPQVSTWAPLGIGPRGGMMGGGFASGPGMMGGRFTGRQGMMGGWSWVAPGTAEPLSIDDAREAVEAYLDRLGVADLEVGEVMVFENHAYAEVEDTAAGSGAFEVLVDPVTRAVSLEFGPAMMWNTQYGMMGSGRHGMMGGGWSGPGSPYSPPATETADVDPEEARALAQAYLDESMPGVTVGEEVDVFPGYFTLHTLRDGEVIGMLSVNAYTGQVWYHTWHGDFVEMGE